MKKLLLIYGWAASYGVLLIIAGLLAFTAYVVVRKHQQAKASPIPESLTNTTIPKLAVTGTCAQKDGKGVLSSSGENCWSSDGVAQPGTSSQVLVGKGPFEITNTTVWKKDHSEDNWVVSQYAPGPPAAKGEVMRSGTGVTWTNVGPAGVPPPDPQKDPIGRLRYDAKKYGIHWKIECDQWSTSSSYNYNAQGWNRAEPPSGVYIEDGAYPYWFDFGATQEAAAFSLWVALQGPPDYQPQHSPSVQAIARPRHECKAPIGSEIPEQAACATCGKEQ